MRQVERSKFDQIIPGTPSAESSHRGHLGGTAAAGMVDISVIRRSECPPGLLKIWHGNECWKKPIPVIEATKAWWVCEKFCADELNLSIKAWCFMTQNSFQPLQEWFPKFNLRESKNRFQSRWSGPFSGRSKNGGVSTSKSRTKKPSSRLIIMTS
jgi:hypothetical protein